MLLRRIRNEERGFALILALGALIALAITVTAVIDYTSSNSRSTNIGAAQMDASHAAEAALIAAYSKLNYTGNNATDPTLLGCAADSTGDSSDCTTPTLSCVSVLSTCSSSTVNGQAGTGTYYGSYDATTAQWTIDAFGYARNPTNAAVIKKTYTATSGITTDINQPPNVAAWNHLYSTASPGSGCEVTVNGNNVVIDVPVYVTGDMCLAGQGASVQENTSTGGQAVDLRVVGRLVYSGNNTKVGASSTQPITSGIVGQGCSTSITGTLKTCAGNFNYWVRNTDSAETLTAPTADASTWYQDADPGPKHPCKSGTTPAPLASSTFDNDTVQNDSAGTFNLTPSTAYSCLSQTGTGQLTWNPPTGNQTAGTLAISGVVFIDGSLTLTQSATYSGKGSIYVAGSVNFPNQNTNICANSTCSFSSWNPNANMLMIVDLGSGVSFTGNTDTFQGSMFAQPTSAVSFIGQSINYQGPLVAGSMSWGNNVTMQPLPTINQLPPGAPLAVNARAVPGRLSYTAGG